jgi:hypothetical protein
MPWAEHVLDLGGTREADQGKKIRARKSGHENQGTTASAIGRFDP